MRPLALALLLLLLQLPCCSGRLVPFHNCTTTLSSSAGDNTCEPCGDLDRAGRDALYAALNGECAGDKARVNSCCDDFNGCLNRAGSPTGKQTGAYRIPPKSYARCGLERARCIEKDPFRNGACQKATESVRTKSLLSATRGNKPAADLQLYSHLGITGALYGNCTVGKVKIDECSRALHKCVKNHEKRKPGLSAIEPYECSNNGADCLEKVMDWDRSIECAAELGHAAEVMRRFWEATVDGEVSDEKDEDDEDDEEKKAPSTTKTKNPFTYVVDEMRRRWGMSWWMAVAFIVGATLALTAVCCCLCYWCAAASLAREQSARDLAAEQKRRARGLERYSTAESSRPSSVRVSRYSAEEEE